MRFSHFALAAAVLVAPAITSARVVDLHPDAIGITEADYYTLKSSHCYYEGAPSTAVHSAVTGALCDPLLAQLAGQIVFRAQHYGEMYQVNDGDGWGPLTRYLPDGFYEAGGTLYWVAEGRRTRLPESDGFRRILLTAQRNPSMVTYVKENSLTTDQQRSLRGRIVVMVDQNHSLAYVADPIYGSDLRTLSQKNSAELEEIIGNEIIHVSAKLIKKLPVNNDWQ